MLNPTLPNCCCPAPHTSFTSWKIPYRQAFGTDLQNRFDVQSLKHGRAFGSAIDQGRCQLATDALANGFEETLWIESVIGFYPNDVDRLRHHQLPIACGIYLKKGVRELACPIIPGTEKLTFD